MMPLQSADTSCDLSPVTAPAGAEERTESATALCLSGGGFRAMLFHVGVLWRLNELGQLPKLDYISSVSGGSITAALLGMKWKQLDFDANGRACRFQPEVVEPLLRFADRTVDAWAIGLGALSPFSTISEEVEKAYRKHLFGTATLQALPDAPRFIINATNVQTGVLFRFSKRYQGDYRIGLIKNPQTPLTRAVAASSAFPPVLSPGVMSVAPDSFDPAVPAELTTDAFRSKVVLSDGGVYDNLGLETVWKRCRTILVSDAGQKIADEARPASDWARHAVRVLDIIDNQVRSLRKRMLIAAYQRQERAGAYWGIRTNIADYGRPEQTLPCPYARTLQLAAVPTRLAKMDETTKKRLINWGYAVCDAGMRTHVLQELPAPAAFPYPVGV